MSNPYFRAALLGTTVIAGMAFTAPAFAQTQPAPTPTQPGQTSPAEEGPATAPDPNTTENPVPSTTGQATATDQATQEGDEIVVTGSILRRTNTETPSPVTVLSSESLAQRGINTAAEAVQRVSANNAGTIQAGWNTGFNFASGANAPALRGLTVQNTLSIFDGLRMAPYPLADDGQRNFVDLNTIPNAVIDRIEVLRDGASSTYGADAIAGVVNIITKKEIQGLHLGASAGISQRGDAGEQRLDVTWGYGDLDEDGFNFYVSGEYQNQEELWARDRDFPFNTQDLSSICNSDGSCMTNLNWNGVSESGAWNGFISIPGVGFVRRSGVGALPGDPNFRFQMLNPADGCRGWDPITLTPAQLDPTLAPSAPANGQVCEVNFQEEYIMLSPDIERFGGTARITANVGEDHQVYAMGTFYRTDTFAQFTPLGFNGTPTQPIPLTLAPYNVILPVFVCPTGAGTPNGLNTGCNAGNGVLNPYNPFAAEGNRAQMFIRSTRPRSVETNSRALRGVLGVSGTIFDDVRYSTDLVASEVRLVRKQSGYLIPQRIMDAVARGEINFFDLEATPENVWDFISPTQRTTSVSKLWQWQGTLAKDLMDLPGGPLQAAIGLQFRQESINSPSANPPLLDQNGLPDPTQNQYLRYYSINAVSAKGSRNVKSGFFEINAPFMDLATNGFGVEANLSGRYDKYSTGQKNFSPKVGVKVTPMRELALRGTWSKGFRIPSFNESFGQPTTGFVTQNLDCTPPYTDPSKQAFCEAHGGNAYAENPFPVGLTQVGNPDLEPEKSTSFTAGLIFEPIRNVSFTVDFWNIKVKNLIVGISDIGPVVDAYYACTAAQVGSGTCPVPPGFAVLPANPDPNFPNALPHLGFIQSPYKNTDQQIARGIDFGFNARYNITDGIRWSSNLEASYLLKYELTTESGSVQRYDGTLSPCNITSCSGAPKWRASWQNTFEFGDTSLTATLYYTKGLDMASTDFGATKGDCTSAINFGSAPTFEDGTPVMCKSEDIWNLDMTASHKVNDKLTLYANVLNVLDDEPPFDHGAAYGIFNFNPAWAGPNIMGRYFRIGAKVDF